MLSPGAALSVAAGIEADLGHDQGTLPGKILQPGEIGFERSRDSR
jgi:hypothetical protein